MRKLFLAVAIVTSAALVTSGFAGGTKKVLWLLSVIDRDIPTTTVAYIGTNPVSEVADAVHHTRHAGLLVHDRRARPAQAVDERRLPDVREADDGDRSLHAGGIATRGRPCSCVVTRNSHSRRISAWISCAAAR